MGETISAADLASQAGRRPIDDRPVAPVRRQRPAAEGLAGSRSILVPVDPAAHTAALFAIGHADDRARSLWDYLPYGPFPDPTAMATWLTTCAASRDPIFMTIGERSTTASETSTPAAGVLAGMASFMRIEPAHGVIEIGHIWLAPPFQRTVLATEALFLLIDHALATLGYRRLEWKCNALNTASRRAALRLGFRFEGVFHNHLIVKGRNRDTAWYSLLAEEWPAVRAHFQTWLAPANFTADGRQRTSLAALNRALW